MLRAPAAAAAGGVGIRGTGRGGGSALLMPSWRCLGPGGGIWGRISMDGGRHPLLCTVPGWGRERQRVLGGERGGMMDTAGCAVPPLCLEIWARRSAGVCDPPPLPPLVASLSWEPLEGGGKGGVEVAARCDPILQRTPEMGGVEWGVGADPTDSHRMVAVGSGGAQIKEGGGLQGCLCKQTTGGSSSIPGIGTDPAGGPTTPPAPEGWI